MRRGKRGRFEIYGDILEAINEEVLRWGGAQLTRVQLKSNMSYDRFKEDLLKLRDRGLVSISEIEGGSNSVCLTTAGKEYLASYKKVQKFIDDYGL